jgi:uncharacterized protein
VNPFFFGRSQQPLFGIYHPAKGDLRGHGVVLCPPIGQEYMRTHRALRQLALQLNKAGFDTLRFDFSGIGDSAGDNTVASLEGWMADLALAIDELKDTANVKTVSVVGIRIGASVGYLGTRQRKDIDSVVMWDPVVRGADYVAELVALADQPGHEPEGETIGVTGFALTPAFRQELRSLVLDEAVPHAARRLFVLGSELRPAYERLHEVLAAAGLQAQHAHIPSGANWDDAEQMGAVILPQAIIQAIVAQLSS